MEIIIDYIMKEKIGIEEELCEIISKLNVHDLLLLQKIKECPNDDKHLKYKEEMEKIEKNNLRIKKKKAIIKGKTPRDKKDKYLNQFELQKLIKDLNLNSEINNDWLIYLIAKTGLRFSEALALTLDDFDFVHQVLNVDKTWNYKEKSGFEPTKNKSSERKVQLDWQTVIQFSELIKNLEKDKPIFIKKIFIIQL